MEPSRYFSSGIILLCQPKGPQFGTEKRDQRQTGMDIIQNEDPPMDEHLPDHDYCSSAEPAAIDLALDHIQDLQAEIASQRKQMEEMALSNKYGL
uniref:Si:dkey-177p2.16 n=1 Tax=Nothobranchius kuhntae TaxID=321403 RepID=A0A1A8KZ84_NOTKU